MTTWILALLTMAQAQYLAGEPAVGKFLEGIRFCVKEPMAGVQNEIGLGWLSEVKSGDDVCVRNAAKLIDSNGTRIIFENSAGQIRALKITGPIDAKTCRDLKEGLNGPDFDFKTLSQAVAQKQKQILQESEVARPARTSNDLLQFALCHGALENLIRENKLNRVLSNAESKRLTHVHRPPDVYLQPTGEAGR